MIVKQDVDHSQSIKPLPVHGASIMLQCSNPMTLLFPERTIASWLRSGVPLLETNPKRPQIKPHDLPQTALEVPIMCNPGTQEGVTVTTGKFKGTWPANLAFIEAVRKRDGLLGGDAKWLRGS